MITMAVFETKTFDREPLQAPEALADIARTTVANLEALATGRPVDENSVLT